MFEQFGFETILDRMMSNVSDSLDKREGSVIYDALAPAALELANYYAALDMVMREVFADTASYHFLIKRAAERCIYPKEETPAICRMEVMPADTKITIGDRFNLNDLNYTVTAAMDDKPGSYQITCETAGVAGNQQLGLLLPIETENELNQMERAELTEVLVPGEDEEDVETFRERYFASFHNQAYGGNKADYIEKVNDMPGVGGCKVFRAWHGGYKPSGMIPSDVVARWFESLTEEDFGPVVYGWLQAVYNAAAEKLLTVGGTVKVYIISSEFKAPTETLIKNVQDTLDPTVSAGEGDGAAPIGHVVNVIGVKEFPINIGLSIEYQEGYSFAALREPIENAIDEYLAKLRQSWAKGASLIVRISQIEYRLLEIDGIFDLRDTTLNGQEKNIIIDFESIPVRGEIIAR